MGAHTHTHAIGRRWPLQDDGYTTIRTILSPLITPSLAPSTQLLAATLQRTESTKPTRFVTCLGPPSTAVAHPSACLRCALIPFYCAQNAHA
jgi:hypothetical protein